MKSGGRVKKNKREKEKKKETNGRKIGRRKERKGGGVGDYEVFNFPNLGFFRGFIFLLLINLSGVEERGLSGFAVTGFGGMRVFFFKETCAYTWPTGFFCL